MTGLMLPLAAIGFAGVAEAQSPDAGSNPNASPCAPGGPQYPPSNRRLEVDRNNVPPGGQFVGQGCASPRSTVNLTLFSHPKPLGSVTADATGFFRGSFTVPCDAEPGAHTVRTTGGLESSAGINVSGEGAGICAASVGGGQDTGGQTGGAGNERSRDRGDLPRTGSSSTAPLAAAGIGLVLIGAATAITARRRRSTESA
ncbi:MAG TPA: LPXTG cell wall anchor domain-containing protein [Acidimicrobiales bacterium]|nr:LPXTG cell wall anchor domain-containing protein [Acidimicrobiales bacterium]